MNDKLINKVISITSMETKAGQYGAMAKIKDEKGLTYTVFEQKKDGSTSVAWEQLQSLKIGANVQISFSEEVKTHPEHGNYTARTIRSFNEDIGNGASNYANQSPSTPSAFPGRGEAPRASQGASGDDFWEKKAYKQCLWGYFLEKQKSAAIDGGITPLAQHQIDMVWDTFKQIEKDADKRFSPLSEPKANEAASLEPVIHADEDLGADLPF